MVEPSPSSLTKKMPQRPLGSIHDNPRLPRHVSIIGLGCSSFSTFFWTKQDADAQPSSSNWSVDTLSRSHPRVQEWIDTIQYAVLEAGITLLDTAPWYGHGVSEVVVGWALEELLRKQKVQREDLTVNTKVGRYEADPTQQFDFSKNKTVESVQTSLKRLQISYIDTLQLHDPEFCLEPTQLLEETIPAMLACQAAGQCRALGMTGYPLRVQHAILQACLEKFGRNVFDQSLTYGHFNLHDTSLFAALSNPVSSSEDNERDSSFADYCQAQGMAVLAAAPLNMGLLTEAGPPDWHPASPELQDACRRASLQCKNHNVNLSALAILHALAEPRIPCTILGMKNIPQVKEAAALAHRFGSLDLGSLSHRQVLSQVATAEEWAVWQELVDPEKSPFAGVWESGEFQWDGLKGAKEFWQQVEADVSLPDWQPQRLARSSV